MLLSLEEFYANEHRSYQWYGSHLIMFFYKKLEFQIKILEFLNINLKILGIYPLITLNFYFRISNRNWLENRKFQDSKMKIGISERKLP